MFVEHRTRMYRMAAIASPSVLVPAVSAVPAVPVPVISPDTLVRPRFRRLVVFTGRLP
jgi:hypothetical protein